MRARARTMRPRRGLLSATGSIRASMKPPPAGSARTSARPIRDPAPTADDRNALVPVLREKHAQGIVRTLDVVNHPAVRSVHDDEVHRDRASPIVEGNRDI